MPSFSDSFWSNGYGSGINVLFEKLSQGCVENDEVLAMAAARAEAEEQYGHKLQDIPTSYGPKKSGFGKDDGASLKRAYEGIVKEMGEEGRNHIQVAENVRRMVIVPFGKWADEHRQRVEYSNGVLKSKIKTYEKELSEVQKAQRRYFNKCRNLEESKEAEIIDGEVDGSSVSQDSPELGSNHELQEPSSELERPYIAEEPVELGGEIYSPEVAKKLFRHMLESIPQHTTKVAILGTYTHVSSGDAIVAWVLKNISNGSISEAEKFGQSLVNEGYIRLVGQVGNKFANSSVMNYQWRKKFWLVAGREVPSDLALPKIVNEYIGNTLQNYMSNSHGDETPLEKLQREMVDSDKKYRDSVQKLDEIRCDLEESTIDHLKFMERCEYDRLKAIKAVFLDFIAALSNVVPTIQSSVDKFLLFQETVHPANDLRYILESYRTGSFCPKVTIYDNYFNSADDQTFGVDLELKCRSDKKRVPVIVSSILSYMDSLYPELDNDEVRLSAWTAKVPLKQSHELRKKLNVGMSSSSMRDLLSQYGAPIITSVLKLYLVELPDSLIPSQYYDVIKTIYLQRGTDEDSKNRIAAIQNTFSQLRVSNIATLDAIVTHLTRLMDIAKAPDTYRTQLAQEFSHCLLRPRIQSALTIGDRHVYRVVLDLLTFGHSIFTELKRKNSGNRSSSVQTPVLKDMAAFSTTPVRRDSLQNRMDALTLKMRKGNVNSRTSSTESGKSAVVNDVVNGTPQIKVEQSPTAGELLETNNERKGHERTKSVSRQNESLTSAEAVAALESQADIVSSDASSAATVTKQSGLNGTDNEGSANDPVILD